MLLLLGNARNYAGSRSYAVSGELSVAILPQGRADADSIIYSHLP